MWTLSGFADEISPDLDLQLETLLREGIRQLELRSAWGKNVLALTDAEIETVKRNLERSGIKVSSIGSRIGKIKIMDDFSPHLAAFDRALHVSRVLDASFICIFSFFIFAGADRLRYL